MPVFDKEDKFSLDCLGIKKGNFIKTIALHSKNRNNVALCEE